MIGSLRFLLCYLVLLSHLTGSIYAQHFGYYAVRAFFVISGFLVTAALNEVYRFDGVRFWTNRFLRLVPLYYFVCLITLAVLILLPTASGQYHFSWRHSSSLGEWGLESLMNLLVLPLQFTTPEFRLVPPYWSVAVEFVMYFLLYQIVARNIHCAIGFLVIGIGFQVFAVQSGWTWKALYFSAGGAMLPYAYGALIYFLNRQGVLQVRPFTAAFAFALWLANLVLAGSVLPESYVYGTGFVLNGIVFAVVVAGVAQRGFGAAVARCDRTLGEIAYPVFLVHMLVGFLVAVTFFPGSQRGWLLTLVATPFIVAAGFALAWVNRRFVEPMRLRVRETPRESPLPLEGATARAG